MQITKWLVAVALIFGGSALAIYAMIGLLVTPFEVGSRYGSQGMDTTAGIVLLVLGCTMALFGLGCFVVFGTRSKEKPDAD